MSDKKPEELSDPEQSNAENDNQDLTQLNQMIAITHHPNLPEKILESTLTWDFSKLAIQLKQRYRLHPKILEHTPITQNMRARLRGFLMAESQKQCLLRETTTLACTYIDLFFLNKGYVEIQEFQNMAIGCLILATKVKEGRFPTISFNIFDRQQLLSYQKKIAKRLNYFLSPPTYHTFAERVVYLWDQFIQQEKTYNIKFAQCHGKTNLKMRAYYEHLDYVYMTLKSLSYSIQQITLNLFYLHARFYYLSQPNDPSKMDKNQFLKAFYPKNDVFKEFFQRFILFCSTNIKKLSTEIALFLKAFLRIEPTKKEWVFKENHNISKIFAWEKLQTSTKDNYAIFKILMQKVNNGGDKKK